MPGFSAVLPVNWQRAGLWLALLGNLSTWTSRLWASVQVGARSAKSTRCSHGDDSTQPTDGALDPRGEH